MVDLTTGIYDTITVADNLSPVDFTIKISTSDSIISSDSLSPLGGNLDLIINVSDSLSTSDFVSVFAGTFYVRIYEQIIITDTISGYGIYPQTLQDRVKALLQETLGREPTDAEVLNGMIDYDNTGLIGGFDIGTDYLSITDRVLNNTTKISSGAIAFQSGPTGAPTCTITQSGILNAVGAVISGQLIAGYVDIPDIVSANSMHIDTNGNTWWGATTLANSLAKVTNDGKATFSGISSLNMRYFTSFENTARFGVATKSGTGVISFTTSGAMVYNTAGVGYAKLTWNFGGGSTPPTDNYQFYTEIVCNSTLGDSGSYYVGLGNMTVSAAAGHTFINAHIGFKVIMTATEQTLYLTQANGANEETHTVGVITGADTYQVIFKINNDHTSVDYYYRNVVTSVPVWTKVTLNNYIPSNMHPIAQISVSSENTITANNILVSSMSIER